MSAPAAEFPYAQPTPTPPVVAAGEFQFAVAHLDHAHIYSQTEALLAAGATLAGVFDTNPKRIAAFLQRFGAVPVAARLDDLLDNPNVQLIAAAAVPAERAAIGMRILRAGKDYFTDKSPFTTLAQLQEVRAVVAETSRKYLVYYAERLHNRPTWYAAQLAREGAIGRVLQVLIMAPHNLAKAQRPRWFFDKAQYGGILTDIGSHQFEQFLHVANADGGDINFARVANLNNPDHPGFEDFGEASLTLSTGASAYCRVDWFNPAASRTWGDGRAFLLGTDGYLEVRQNIDAGNRMGTPCVILVNQEEERLMRFDGTEPLPFFGQMILDCLARTEHAMTQAHAFAAAELSMRAQAWADGQRSNNDRDNNT